MRMMMYVSFPVETFNAAARDGSVGRKIQAILEAQKPESVYFTDLHGKRTAVDRGGDCGGNADSGDG